jgi:hypothetical protein
VQLKKTPPLSSDDAPFPVSATVGFQAPPAAAAYDVTGFKVCTGPVSFLFTSSSKADIASRFLGSSKDLQSGHTPLQFFELEFKWGWLLVLVAVYLGATVRGATYVDE